MSSGKSTVDTRTLKKDLKRLGSSVSSIADEAVRVSITQASAFYMQFDEVEAVPYSKSANGKIVVSGPGLVDSSDGSFEDILALQTSVAVSTLQAQINKGLREVLK